ncbi:MAG: Phosphoribosylanthranilate isomerase [Candidatus Collierbacteria bacterium GW2011_GWF2_44_15]|uniref:Phosphoribosylanthranilate isomerase n=1 Tax=Candidatus Collierbacteria bacterium GW2011_GWF2_44_15 TaxID=1618404 RepID=A0A0G1K8W8_9BACT|nr:MAG: Phosphoribosylanthranilate isomerase [Candidatus Collierbacteria bacterium GW2011_GWF2_44_15]
MSVKLGDYKKVDGFLRVNNVDSILYGSLGVSAYLGNFRDFDDIDLLVDDEFIGEKWSFLKELMSSNGFEISDEKEHEFVNPEGVKVAFAEKSVLIDDNICDPKSDVVKIIIDGVEVNTLSPNSFIKAYTFSSTDGYRIEKRGDSDLNIVRDLKKLKEFENRPSRRALLNF